MSDYPLLSWEEILEKEQKACKTALEDPMRLRFHLMPPVGWLNDPNGLCEADGVNHIFFQYNPVEPAFGTRNHWGHYETKDFVHYTYRLPALSSEEAFERNGVYTGSILPTREGLKAYYTGNVKEPGDHDYTHTGREHNTVLAENFDGERFLKKTVLMRNEDYPDDLTLHVRDPKVFERDGKIYMVLGARRDDDTGEVLLYASDNGRDFELIDRVRYPEDFGYMWECPDLIQVNGKDFLIFSPQGIDARGRSFQNVYQSGYAQLKGFPDAIRLEPFEELDAGFDFYAPQTYTDEDGRVILIGWMGLPDTEPEYSYPTKDAGWMHALTLPRELAQVDGKIYQKPIEELKDLRESELNLQAEGHLDLTLPKSCELLLRPKHPLEDFRLDFEGAFSVIFRNGILSLDFTKGEKMKQAGAGRGVRSRAVGRVEELRIFLDTSSVEIFVNGGACVFSSRYFADRDLRLISSDFSGAVSMYTLRAFDIRRPDGSPLYG